MPRRAGTFVTLCASTLVCAATADAQQVPRWAVAVEGGVSDIHGETEAEGGAVAFTAGWADEDFQTAEAGVELRLCPSCRITGFIGGGGGFLNEPDWNGGMLRASAGFEVRLTSRLAARGLLGVSYRFGGISRPAASP
jgi:hypothetical protein